MRLMSEKELHQVSGGYNFDNFNWTSPNFGNGTFNGAYYGAIEGAIAGAYVASPGGPLIMIGGAAYGAYIGSIDGALIGTAWDGVKGLYGQ